VYHNKHPKVLFNGGKKSIAYKRMKEYMTLFKQVANRKTGMGLKLLKFHQLLHLWFIIRAYGSLSNIDSAMVQRMSYFMFVLNVVQDFIGLIGLY
jgi:hypothetical protein